MAPRSSHPLGVSPEIAGAASAPLTGPRRSSPQRGFTLIEVLIVMAIVGLVASGVSLSLDALRARDTQHELERLRLVLEATAERARVQGQPIAFDLLADGYRFSRLNTDGRWLPLEDAPVFVSRVLPEGMRWSGLRSDLGQDQRLVFSHRAPRFELDVQTPGQRAQLRGTATGAVVLHLAHDS